MDKEKITLDGTQCNKIGVGYTAFRYEAGKCTKPVGSCTKNQIFDYVKKDNEKISKGSPPDYFIFGQGSWEKNENLNETELVYLVEGSLSTVVTLELNADSIKFIENLGMAVIDSLNVKDFEANSGGGFINITILNIGTLKSEFAINFECSKDI